MHAAVCVCRAGPRERRGSKDGMKGWMGRRAQKCTEGIRARKGSQFKITGVFCGAAQRVGSALSTLNARHELTGRPTQPRHRQRASPTNGAQAGPSAGAAAPVPPLAVAAPGAATATASRGGARRTPHGCPAAASVQQSRSTGRAVGVGGLGWGTRRQAGGLQSGAAQQQPLAAEPRSHAPAGAATAVGPGSSHGAAGHRSQS